MKNRTRTGKIARLPRHIREQVNRRLEDGEAGGPLLQWLNSLPEVQAVMAAEFGGKPIRKQNLSEWRAGGYGVWLERREALDMAGELDVEAMELVRATSGPVSDRMAVWVMGRYLMVARELEGQEAGRGEVWKQLREFSKDMVAFRRSDNQSSRISLEWEKFHDAKKGLLDRGLEELANSFKDYPDAKAAYIQAANLLKENLRREGKVVQVSPA